MTERSVSTPKSRDRSVTESFDQTGAVVERLEPGLDGASPPSAFPTRIGRRKVAARSGAVPVVKPRAAARIPTARLPRTDRRFGSGVLVVTVVYGLIGVVALLVGGRALDDYQKALGDGGPLGGGGGGGGARQVQYIELPPLPSPARRTAQAEPKRPPEPVIPPPDPVVEPKAELKTLEPEITQVAVLPEERPAINVETPGTGSGTGTGPGAGSGTGGGIGTGQGTGIGAGVGRGTGGEGGAVVAPAVRTVVYPFEEPPAEIRGIEFRVRFWVDARGRPTKVEIDPPIEDSSFRKKLLERMQQWTFYPARTLEGRPVDGQLLVTYQP